jgi:hypothetical protein
MAVCSTALDIVQIFRLDFQKRCQSSTEWLWSIGEGLSIKTVGAFPNKARSMSSRSTGDHHIVSQLQGVDHSAPIDTSFSIYHSKFKSWSSAADLLASFHSRNEDYDESFASIHTSGSSMDGLLRFGNPCPGSQTQHHLHHDR